MQLLTDEMFVEAIRWLLDGMTPTQRGLLIFLVIWFVMGILVSEYEAGVVRKRNQARKS